MLKKNIEFQLGIRIKSIYRLFFKTALVSVLYLLNTQWFNPKHSYQFWAWKYLSRFIQSTNRCKIHANSQYIMRFVLPNFSLHGYKTNRMKKRGIKKFFIYCDYLYSRFWSSSAIETVCVIIKEINLKNF